MQKTCVVQRINSEATDVLGAKKRLGVRFDTCDREVFLHKTCKCIFEFFLYVFSSKGVDIYPRFIQMLRLVVNRSRRIGVCTSLSAALTADC
jgi:hypothetical protein